MMKELELTAAQAQALYIILSKEKLTGTDNRHRWRFIETITEFVEDYEAFVTDNVDDQKIIAADKEKPLAENRDALRELRRLLKEKSEETRRFTFKSKESYIKVKDVFERAGNDLSGDLSKQYYQLEDVFADAKDIPEEGDEENTENDK